MNLEMSLLLTNGAWFFFRTGANEDEERAESTEINVPFLSDLLFISSVQIL